jgi:hypothetical protein
MTGGNTASNLREDWYDFGQKVRQAIEILEAEQLLLKQKAQAYQNQLRDNPYLLQPYNNRQHWTASRKLSLLIEWGTDRLIKISKKMMAAGDTVERWRKEYNDAMANIESCGGRYDRASQFNAKANSLVHERNNELINFYEEFFNQQAKLFLCSTTDRSIYDLNISVLKSSFLTVLQGLRCEFEVGCDKPEEYKPMGKILPDYDEMNCQYKTELSIPYAEKYFSIKVECNKMTTKFDAKYLKGSLEENLANGKYKGTVEIEGKIGSDKEQIGPIEMGTQVKAGAGVEFTEGGIQDVYVSGKAGVKAGDLTLGSVEARVSVVTGTTTISGKGAFSGISIK